jgi:creatinine amidohydrolase/Fe(II)-dependent formamide hydrolase-like protein
MNREELRTAAPESLAVLPIGATEAHGLTCPRARTFRLEMVARERRQLTAMSR